jgi:hypothetical protein
VAQHAFEYAVFQSNPSTELPPYLLEVVVGGKDYTELGRAAMCEPFPLPYDLYFNRITASAAVDGMRALLAGVATRTHLPGVLGLVGGYPVIVEHGRVRLDLAENWSEAEAVATNEASLWLDGIESVERDGSIVFNTATVEALHTLTGATIERVHPDSAMSQARLIMKFLS